MKQRTKPIVDLLQTSKDADRSNVLVCTDLARQYRTKAEELEAKHQQLSEIHQEFQDKLYQKMVRLLFLANRLYS